MASSDVKPGDSVLCWGCGEAFEAEQAMKATKLAAVALMKPSVGSVGIANSGGDQPLSRSKSSFITSSVSSSSRHPTSGQKRPRALSSTSSDERPSSEDDEQTDP